MPYSWLLFDADGTLFDFAASETRAFHQTLDAFGIAPDAGHLATFRRVSHVCWSRFERGELSSQELRTLRFSMWSAETGVAVDPVEINQRYMGSLGCGTDLISGAQAALDTLARSHRLALITNGLTDVQRPRLAASSIGHHFEVVVISDEEGVAKPDPALFEIASRRMGDPARKDVLLIGDSLHADMQGGIQYGIDTCWFNPGGATRPDAVPVTHEIARLAELHDIV